MSGLNFAISDSELATSIELYVCAGFLGSNSPLSMLQDAWNSKDPVLVSKAYTKGRIGSTIQRF